MMLKVSLFQPKYLILSTKKKKFVDEIWVTWVQFLPPSHISFGVLVT